MPEVGIIRQGISRYQPQPTTTNHKCHNHQPFLSIIPSKSNGFCAFRFATVEPYGKSGIFAFFVRFGVGPSPKSGIFRVFVRFGVGPYGKSGIFADFVRFGAEPYGKSGICPIGRRESACAKMGVRQMTKRKRNKLIQRQLVCAQNGQGVSGNRTRLLFCHARGIDC